MLFFSHQPHLCRLKDYAGREAEKCYGTGPCGLMCELSRQMNLSTGFKDGVAFCSQTTSPSVWRHHEKTYNPFAALTDAGTYTCQAGDQTMTFSVNIRGNSRNTGSLESYCIWRMFLICLYSITLQSKLSHSALKLQKNVTDDVTNLHLEHSVTMWTQQMTSTWSVMSLRRLSWTVRSLDQMVRLTVFKDGLKLREVRMSDSGAEGPYRRVTILCASKREFWRVCMRHRQWLDIFSGSLLWVSIKG